MQRRWMGLLPGPNDGREAPMGKGGERLLAWYMGGDTDYRLPGTEMVFKVSPQTAEYLRETSTTTGALVTGRRTFDLTNGWGGGHPLGVPVFVLTLRFRQSGFTKSRLLPSLGMASKAL
jgi:dihydrofolate reductase